uniref:Uncharacterized protein n=1 Tax=Rhizophora mucronata TaxID=61149 RepID=A0A2P2IIM5_RHIMU
MPNIKLFLLSINTKLQGLQGIDFTYC